jgi:hypothetical protein
MLEKSDLEILLEKKFFGKTKRHIGPWARMGLLSAALFFLGMLGTGIYHATYHHWWERGSEKETATMLGCLFGMLTSASLFTLDKNNTRRPHIEVPACPRRGTPRRLWQSGMSAIFIAWLSLLSSAIFDLATMSIAEGPSERTAMIMFCGLVFFFVGCILMHTASKMKP